jgi:N-formylglutamate deformylase
LKNIDPESVPPWWVFHVPHDSTLIPDNIRNQFIVSDEILNHEILRMTDSHTHDLFVEDLPQHQVVRFPVSRLVVDVERFERDAEERMSARGMGVIYKSTHDLRPLRRAISASERESLLETWYRPHHSALSAAVDIALSEFGRAFVVDVHSFPPKALPYEDSAAALRPEICIGTDSFHTPGTIVESLLKEFESLGFTTAVDTPFSGALVPAKHYQADKRVTAVMIEVRRDLYMDEATGNRNQNFTKVAQKLRNALIGFSITR